MVKINAQMRRRAKLLRQNNTDTQRKLIIELDGGQHILNKEYDETRTSYLNSLGYIVLRFWNDEVLLHIENVLESIFRCLEESEIKDSQDL